MSVKTDNIQIDNTLFNRRMRIDEQLYAQSVANASLDRTANGLIRDLNDLGQVLTQKYGAKQAANVNAKIQNLITTIKTAVKAAKDPKDPFFFFEGILFTATNYFVALGTAINELASDQPNIIAADMGISNDLVSPEIIVMSNYWVGILQADELLIQQLPPDATPQQVAAAQGKLSVANAASTASSTGLNGVQSMVTQDVSSKTTTLQNLLQQMQQVVTAGINTFSQDWVI